MKSPQLFTDLKTVKEKVLLLLNEVPKLRDSDDDLIATYIYREVGENIKEMTALDLLAKISNSKLTSFETIRRVRIEIQKNNQHLRGIEFGKRKKTKEKKLFKINIRDN
jgi:hypothetical protein